MADGDSFSVTDSNGGVVVYEFDSGYRLQVPQGLTLQAPLAGGASGGIADGDRLIISDGVRTVTFEFDRNGNTLAGNTAIPFTLGSTQTEIAQAVANAISGTQLLVTPRILPGGRVFLGAEDERACEYKLHRHDSARHDLGFEATRSRTTSWWSDRRDSRSRSVMVDAPLPSNTTTMALFTPGNTGIALVLPAA